MTRGREGMRKKDRLERELAKLRAEEEELIKELGRGGFYKQEKLKVISSGGKYKTYKERMDETREQLGEPDILYTTAFSPKIGLLLGLLVYVLVTIIFAETTQEVLIFTLYALFIFIIQFKSVRTEGIIDKETSKLLTEDSHKVFEENYQLKKYAVKLQKEIVEIEREHTGDKYKGRSDTEVLYDIRKRMNGEVKENKPTKED